MLIDCDEKDNQLLRIINTARMIDEMSTHASMYIPMSLPPTRLPQHLNFDRDSQWHTSALFSTALESTTLPTRLRFNRQKRGFFDDLEGALNVNGDQRIAQLQCSVLDSEDVPLVTTTTHGENDDRAPPGNSCTLEEEDGLKRAKPSLDMNLSYFDPGVTFQSTHRRRTSDHVFGAVETKRTARIEAYKKQEPDEDEIIEASRRPRFAGLSVIERFVTPTLSRLVALHNQADTTPRSLIRCLIASRQSSRPCWVIPMLRCTPCFQPHPEPPSESKPFNVRSARWASLKSAKHSLTGLARSATLTRMAGTVDPTRATTEVCYLTYTTWSRVPKYQWRTGYVSATD